jgi:hypothetical protein
MNSLYYLFFMFDYCAFSFHFCNSFELVFCFSLDRYVKHVLFYVHTLDKLPTSLDNFKNVQPNNFMFTPKIQKDLNEVY